jgi:hypothetical protein
MTRLGEDQAVAREVHLMIAQWPGFNGCAALNGRGNTGWKPVIRVPALLCDRM